MFQYFNQPPSKEIIKEIEKAVQDYLALPKMKEVIQDDKYTVQFLLKNEEETFNKITNKYKPNTLLLKPTDQYLKLFNFWYSIIGRFSVTRKAFLFMTRDIG